MSAIAVVGMACRYPDARTPAELWENVLARRRAFRPLPPERLRLADYAGGRSDPDGTYVAEAAVLEGWEFDRVRFRVSGESYRAADAAHWLALEVAADALADAGFAGGEGLPRETTGVLLGNSLTGEFSRAGLMRLRWPFVRRVADQVLAAAVPGGAERAALLAALEAAYKAPFPAPGEETLAGGLSNTIAGRICNHFDLGGGGYTVDGACASSLLAVANACSALAAGDLDVALAGGVDLSLDPFELVGFARAGALAAGEMRVFDRRSAGFLPGEGCGVVVLMRLEDALAARRAPYALVRGWGISSDGAGGLTRPEVEGQARALARAYARAGFGADRVGYFEAHGTGTAVGDETELRALARVRRESGARRPAAVGSVKALIGHTKAAAGVAGMLKAVMALHAQVIPPTAGCGDPRPELAGDDALLRVEPEGGPWPADVPLHAGVSSFGFGGINTHLALAAVSEARLPAPAEAARPLLRSEQDCELFAFAAPTREALLEAVASFRARAALLSRAELGDAAAALAAALEGGPVRAAVVASTAPELGTRLERLEGWLRGAALPRPEPREGVFAGSGTAAPRIGFLFPGQGSPAHPGGGAFRRRFPAFAGAYGRATLPEGDPVATVVAQPAIAAASAACLALLRALGVEAEVAAGHSLGELTALHWGGALPLDALLRTAAARGRAMGELAASGGAMLSLRAPEGEAAALARGTEAVVAGVNAPDRTVVAGPAEAVERVAARAAARGVETQRLAVSHAFHSPGVAAAAAPLAAHLAGEALLPLAGAVASTVEGRLLAAEDDLRALLARQVTAPVLFRQALEAVRERAELWIEVGPGRVLTALAAPQLAAPVAATDAGGESLAGLLSALGCAFALGAPVRVRELFAGRFVRPIDLGRAPRFLASPCEAPPPAVLPEAPAAPAPAPAAAGAPHPPEEGGGALETVRALVAARAELPPAAVGDHDRLLGDLHLNSLVVGQLVGEAARRLGLPPPAAPLEYSAATVAQVAGALEEARTASAGAPVRERERAPEGIDGWVRVFTPAWEERPLLRRPRAEPPGRWTVLAAEDDPLAAALATAAAALPGDGVVAVLPGRRTPEVAHRLLAAARALEPGASLVVAQRGGGGAGFARSCFLEEPRRAVAVVELAGTPEEDAVRVAAEAAAARRGAWTEARYDARGRRFEPVLALEPAAAGAGLPLGPGDVLLVSGGGRGIAAECALALAEESGAALALLGRSDPAADPTLAASLARMEGRGVRFRYLAADVCDPGAVRAAVRAAESALGPVTALLHGAGVNLPRALAGLDGEVLEATLRPKVDGLRNLLDAVGGGLRLLVAFGSIIARTGLRGEAHYALANEWMALEVERFAAAHPECRALVPEWSVWAGVGMGERLGVLESLARDGVEPIPLDDGIGMLRRLLSAPPGAVTVTVAGRFGPPATVRLRGAGLPLLRFLERTPVHYPGVELVAEADLTAEMDPYLEDHVLAGERVFPAVLGMEAMAQAAMAAAGAGERPWLEDVEFARPVVVPAGGSRTIRLAALVEEDGEVRVALRSDETGFAVDHFRARCRFGPVPGVEPVPVGAAAPEPVAAEGLYGGILFQGERFRRVAGYRRLEARGCLASLSPDGRVRWFGAYAPPERVMGDPGAHDAAIHAIQPCIPHHRLLPVGVERLVVLETGDDEPREVNAVEREVRDGAYVYDLDVTAPDGRVVERWRGLRLRSVEPVPAAAGWTLGLVRNHLQRAVEELAGVRGLGVWIGAGEGEDRPARSARARRAALGADPPSTVRPDGRPDPAGARAVSVSHAGDLTLAVAGEGPLGCDLEPVLPRPAAAWRDLLGEGGMELAARVAAEAGEGEDAARTRVWAAREALQKAGARGVPLRIVGPGGGGWCLLGAGDRVVPTGIFPLGRDTLAVAVALAGRGSPSSEVPK